MAREIVDADRTEVRELLAQVTGRSEDAKLERMGGLTNRTYRVIYPDGMQYVVRIPGEGTDQLINRRQEAAVYHAIADKNICDDIAYINPENGYKITEFL